MDEKYVFGLVGILLGSLLSALFSTLRELYAENRSKKKEAEYLAIRIICTFDSFIEDCSLVVRDDGLCHGEPDANGLSKIQVSSPQFEINLKDVNWKSLPPDLMYEILYFPNLIKDTERHISSVFEYTASPPDFSQGFEERQYRYSKLGIMAYETTVKLREKYKIARSYNLSSEIVDYFNENIDATDQLRSNRETAHRAMLTTLNSQQTN